MFWLILAFYASAASALFFYLWWDMRPKPSTIPATVTKLRVTTTPRSWEGNVGSYKVRDSDFDSDSALTGPGPGDS
jgi:hypothetical protein